MSCASCVAHVEGALTELEGVTKAVINLGLGTARVTYIPGVATVGAIKRAVREVGYQAQERSAGADALDREQQAREEEIKRQGRNLLIAGIIGLLVMIGTFLKVTALWGGQDGSILFWTWLMSAFTAAVMVCKWDADRPLMPWVIGVSVGTLLFFQGVSLFIANPFERLWFVGEEVVQWVWQPVGSFPAVPRDGQGLNPLLRHPGMVGHPRPSILALSALLFPTLLPWRP